MAMNNSHTTTTTNTTRDIVYLRRPVSDVVKYCSLVVVILGLSGNIFAVASILRRRLHAKSQMFIFFVYMSSADTLAVASMSLSFVVRQFLFTRPYTSADEDGVHGWLSVIFVSFFNSVSKLSSIWILILANGYKLFALFKPLRVTSSDKKFASYSCISVIVIITATNLVDIPAYKLVNIGNDTVYIAAMGVRLEYIPFMFDFFFPLYLALYNIVPGIVLPILSVCIVGVFYKNYRKHASMMRDNQIGATYKKAQTGVMALLPLSVTHICLTMPGFLISVGGIATEKFYAQHQFAFMLLTMNHSVNVYVQFCSSKFYRNTILGR